MTSIDIIMPVYNEEEGIAVFHEALSNTLSRLEGRYRFHILYVVDRSRDRTFDVLKIIAAGDPRVKVIHLSRRFGHQMSLVAGIDHCTADAIIMMDCDLQHPPHVIPELLTKFEEGFDVVHTIREYAVDTGLFKRLTSDLFYRFQNALSPIELTAGAADFRLISRKVARVFQTSLREQNQFLRGLFQWVGFRATSVSFVSPPRAAGATKYGVQRLLTFGIAGILSFSKTPLRLAAFLGLAISALGLIYALMMIVQFFWAGHIPPGYTSLIVAILVIGGLQLVVLGIIGEYVGGIFEEVKRRPLYVVDEVVSCGELSYEETRENLAEASYDPRQK